MPNFKANLDSSKTARWAQAGLASGVVLGICSLIGGGVCLVFQLQDGKATFFSLPPILRETAPLVLNLIVTLLNESMGYIHACSLRWALFREGRLEYSSNLRLLTTSKKSSANSWYANLLCFIGIVLTYASTSLVLLNFNPNLADILEFEDSDGEGRSPDDIFLNSIALLTLGLGLLLQAGVAGWSLGAGKKSFLTWSSNPLTVAKACIDNNGGAYPIQYQDGKCMMSVHMRKEDHPNGVKPIAVQRPLLTAHPIVIWVFCLLWPMSMAAMAWGVTLHISLFSGAMDGVYGESWSFFPRFTGNSDTACDAPSCTDGTSILNLGFTQYTSIQGSVASIFTIAGFQSLITLTLHAAELVINLARDEKTYRQLSSAEGTNVDYNSVKIASGSFSSIFLFITKACVHWMFGLAVSLSFMLGVNMHPPQTLYLACAMLGLAAFCTYLALRRPTGFLPASFGHIQTIVNVVDDWLDPNPMFWGHKSDGDDDASVPAFAGISRTWLEDPSSKHKYGGPRRENDKDIIEEAANRATTQRRRDTIRADALAASRRQSLAASRRDSVHAAVVAQRRQTIKSFHSSTFDPLPEYSAAHTIDPASITGIPMTEVGPGRTSASMSRRSLSRHSMNRLSMSAPTSPVVELPTAPMPAPYMSYRQTGDLSHCNSLASHRSHASIHSSYSTTSMKPLLSQQQLEYDAQFKPYAPPMPQGQFQVQVQPQQQQPQLPAQLQPTQQQQYQQYQPHVPDQPSPLQQQPQQYELPQQPPPVSQSQQPQQQLQPQPQRQQPPRELSWGPPGMAM